MLRQKPVLFSVALALSCSLAHAASPFAGKWKYNAAKSKLTGTTDSVAAAGSNAWKFTYGTFSWTIKADGTDQNTPFGRTVALKTTPTSWVLTNKSNGKLTSTETWVLSADGKSMTRTSTGKREDGSPFTETVIVKRTAGGKGFEGTWEASDVKIAFTQMSVDDNGSAGITAFFPDRAVKVPLLFNGKDSPISGPKIPPGATTNTKVVSPRKLEISEKLAGKLMDSETWEVSSDGKTFTYTEKDPGVDALMVIVLDKQQ